jgi:hypothetical protein
MPAIKNLANTAAKWGVVSSRSGDSYKDGVQDPRKDWQKESVAANSNWKAGTQAAITGNRYQTGVQRTPTSVWQDGAINKGVDRYQAGVLLATGNYERGFAPYHDVIGRTTLPDRKPKGDPSNINRVSIMAKALHDKKLALMAGK